MKKTVTVNLNKCVYTIDEDAYILLKEYLEKLHVQLAGEEGSEEIIADIEARIAELLDERIRFGGLQVISIKEVSEIITTLGRPEDFEIENEAPIATEPPKTENTRRERGRLYRNTKSKVFGGVCSGLADYFGTDPSLVRLIFVLFAFIAGSSIWAYLIMWIVIPVGTETQIDNCQIGDNRKRLYRDIEHKTLGGVCAGIAAYFGWALDSVRLVVVLATLALIWAFPIMSFIMLTYIAAWIFIPAAETTAQKLEMKGEDPTVENIKRYVQDAADKSSKAVEDGIRTIHEKNFIERTISFFGEAFGAMFKVVFSIIGGCMGCLGAIIIVPIIFALVIASIALIFNPLSFNMKLFEHGMTPSEMMYIITNPQNIAMTTIATICVVGIPLLICLYMVIAYFFKLPKINKTAGWILFVVWVAGLIMSSIFTFNILQSTGILH